MSRKRPAHGNRGHRFVGVPVARCIVVHLGKQCTETRTWSQYPADFGMRNQIGGGAVWHSTQIGEDPYGVLDPTMGPYADEGETDPQGAP